MTELTPALLHPLSELVVADATSPEIAALVGTAWVPVLMVSEQGGAFETITTALAGEKLETLHIVAHGRRGAWMLAGQPVTSATLLAHAHLLCHWNVERIALWICEAGVDAEMVGLLQRLTGAKVLASTGVLGLEHSSGQRRWELADDELRLHGAEVFGEDVVSTWPHQLQA